jgi:hypothetical protein
VSKVIQLFLLFCFFFGGNIFADEALKQRFEEEAPAAWKSYSEKIKNCEFDQTSIGGADKSEIIDHKVRISPYFFMESNINGGELIAVNEKYVFHLSKGENNSWILDNCQKLEKPPRVVPPFVMGCMDLTVCDSFIRLAKEPEFKVKEVSQVTENGLNLIRVAYEYEPDKFVPEHFARSGEVFLMPDHDWLLKRSEIQSVENDGTRIVTEVTNEYDFTSESVPVVKKRVITLKYGKGKKNVTMEWNYPVVKLLDDDFPTDQFYLSYYDLPEPDYSGPFNYRPLLIGGGLLLILIAGYLKIRKRARK